MSSTAINQLKQILEKGSNYSYQYEKLTTDPTMLGLKYKSFLSPHSRFFYAPICTLFSFELVARTGNFIKTFDAVNLKDGFFPLLYFFSDNPVPHEIDPILIIDHELKSIVPKAWENKVVLRKIIGKSSLSDVKDLLLVITSDKYSSDLELLKSELGKIKENINSNVKIYSYFTSSQFRGEEIVEKANFNLPKIVSLLHKVFKENEIKVIDWNEYNNISANNMHFSIVNPAKFYFTDSYFFHDLFQRGGIELKSETTEHPDIQLSLNHGYKFSELKEINSDEIYQLVKDLFKGQFKSLKNENEYETCELGTDDLRELAFSIAKKV
jgi:hypothetical protein